jgi:hypothetical protein
MNLYGFLLLRIIPNPQMNMKIAKFMIIVHENSQTEKLEYKDETKTADQREIRNL